MRRRETSGADFAQGREGAPIKGRERVGSDRVERSEMVKVKEEEEEQLNGLGERGPSA